MNKGDLHRASYFSYVSYHQNERDFFRLFASSTILDLPGSSWETGFFHKDMNRSREEIDLWIERTQPLVGTSKFARCEQLVTISDCTTKMFEIGFQFTEFLETGIPETHGFISRNSSYILGEPVFLIICTNIENAFQTKNELLVKKEILQNTIEDCDTWRYFFDYAPANMGIVELIDDETDIEIIIGNQA
jgi:hypothetical protein